MTSIRSAAVHAAAFLVASMLGTGAPLRAADRPSLEPFPPPKSVQESSVVGGRKIDYVLTVGAIPLEDAKGEITGEVVYTSYVVRAAAGAGRPVTFAVNGGPGAASAYLNLGAIGPKRVDSGRDGIFASDSAALIDNANSWLDFTDLVFIDPIGTGYSRSRLDADATLKTFLKTDEDIHYLADVIDTWLRLNDRSLSPKYLIGESYGGYRVPRLAAYLQSEMGIGVSGITLVSPALDPAALMGSYLDALSPLRWMIDLPSMAAIVKERAGEVPTAQGMAPVELYARTEFVRDFLAGQRDAAAVERVSARVAEYLKLDPKLVRRLDGRVPIEVFLRESTHDQGKIGSFYEGNEFAYDPFPERARSDYIDPSLGGSTAFAEAMVNLVNAQVGWKVNARYYLDDYQVALTFDHENYDRDLPVTDLRKAAANDPHMSVLIAHGYNDLTCPYLMSKLVVDQMPDFGPPGRVKIAVYPGGHMFYARPESAAAFKRDASSIYRAD
jgi:carboxypeptidase C (cathepsin A)